MSIFKKLSTVLDNQELTLHVKKSNEKLIVTILPKPTVKDDAKDLIIPLILKGTPEEIDEELVEAITVFKSIDKTSNNLAQFENSKKKFEEENKAKKEIADNKKKEVDKAEKELEKVEEYIKNKDFDKAEFLVNNALKIDKNNQKAIMYQEEILRNRPKQVSIFDVEEEKEEEKKVDDIPIEENNEDENAQATYEEHISQELDDEMKLLEELQEEETDEDIKEQLLNFDIQVKSNDNYDPMEEEKEFWSRREYEQQQQQQVSTFNGKFSWKN